MFGIRETRPVRGSITPGTPTMTRRVRVTSTPTACASLSAQAAICSATYAPPRRSVDHLRGKRIPRLGSLKDLSDRIDLGTAGLPISPHDTSGANLILEAALQAGLGLQRIATDRQIADLTGGAVLAANELAVDIKSQSDAATEREEGDVGDVLRTAMPYFPEQREIDVIFKDDAAAEFLTQQAHDIELTQTGDVGGHLDGAALGVHHPRGG